MLANLTDNKYKNGGTKNRVSIANNDNISCFFISPFIKNKASEAHLLTLHWLYIELNLNRSKSTDK